jgi:hypothetical protein
VKVTHKKGYPTQRIHGGYSMFTGFIVWSIKLLTSLLFSIIVICKIFSGTISNTSINCKGPSHTLLWCMMYDHYWIVCLFDGV